MRTCPICDTANHGPICTECGFDPSADLTRFPTFAVPAAIPTAPSVLRAEREVLRCSRCGGSAFGFRLKQRSFYCLGCRTVLSNEQLSRLLEAPIEPIPPGRPTAIAAGSFHSVVLHDDGTLRAIGSNTDGQCNVADWTGITAVAAGFSLTLGLKADGTVVSTDSAPGSAAAALSAAVREWTGILQLSSGGSHVLGLKKNGTAVVIHDGTPNQEPIVRWRDLTAVAAGYWHSVGLKSNGTVVATGQNSEKQCRTNLWRNITAIAAGGFHTVGLKKNGTALATGDDNCGQCQVSDWTNLTAICAGCSHTVGLRADGTVVATGNNDCGQCEVTHWSDVIAISAGEQHTLGLTAGGTILAAGSMERGQCDTAELMK